MNEAINLAQQFPAGPVQVNVPLREPFYPKAGEELRFEKVKIIETDTSEDYTNYQSAFLKYG